MFSSLNAHEAFHNWNTGYYYNNVITGEGHGKASACIRCGKCVSACCMGLEPYLLKNLAKIRDFDALKEERVLDCIECGSCSFTCPAGIPITDYIRYGKATVTKILRSKK
jgi:electron transport complex protein RnfC